MPFEQHNRAERRMMAKYAREEASHRPVTLTEIPRSRWPTHYLNDPKAPVKAYESRKYLAQLYDAGAHESRTAMRLSICRVTLGDDGRWEEGLGWEELMQVKRECGYGDWYAVEVYPQDSEVVNVANMRHLWLIGWFRNADPTSGQEKP